MELVPSLPHGFDQAGRLENVEVLRNALPRGAHLVLRGQTCTELEERLAVAVRQLVKDGAPDRRCNGFKNIAHSSTIGKSWLACQDRLDDPFAQSIYDRGCGNLRCSLQGGLGCVCE